MPGGSKPRNPMDPTDMWKQWYEATPRTWAQAIGGSKQAYVTPYAFYRLWFQSVNNAQEQFKTASVAMLNTKELWNQWYEATVGAWRQAVERGGDPLGLTKPWLDLMEELRRRIMSTDVLPKDPFTFFKEWYATTSGTWAEVVDDMLSSEKFIESSSPFLEVYATFVKTLRRANEEYFKNLQIPTRSDITRVAEMVVTLEEKVDDIEDALEEDQSVTMATREVITGLDERLGPVEHKLDALSTGLEKQTAAGTAEVVAQLTRRMDEVESKLDRVLAALVKLEVKAEAATGNSANGSSAHATNTK
jgi:polyhydroxyalkanoic acid synthase PhaR subunit